MRQRSSFSWSRSVSSRAFHRTRPLRDASSPGRGRPPRRFRATVCVKNNNGGGRTSSRRTKPQEGKERASAAAGYARCLRRCATWTKGNEDKRGGGREGGEVPMLAGGAEAGDLTCAGGDRRIAGRPAGGRAGDRGTAAAGRLFRRRRFRFYRVSGPICVVPSVCFII
ncbi:hypothetical protein BS78_09G013700 [Paspalum vaginatum]|nr:hypothetical protein BS78_09G013700 [Paspalum vaginatum]